MMEAWKGTIDEHYGKVFPRTLLIPIYGHRQDPILDAMRKFLYPPLPNKNAPALSEYSHYM